MLKKLPIGIQTFSEIREGNYVYIDKTKEAYELIKNYKYVFLSRPRRFGKSLFTDTLHNIFEGRKEYFEGLYIYDKWDWDDTYPVIKIAFGGSRSAKELISGLFSILRDNERRLEVQTGIEDDYAVSFKELIYQVYAKYNTKVVILIDEYDKPILDNLDKLDEAYENREILKRLYTEIKNSDQYIRFTFLTGVSKFSKASIFSGLNMLEDISLNPEFGDICGYTQNDIETTFRPYLEGVDLSELKEWYNGYNFLKDNVYNPFDILQFIRNNHTFDNYWFATGTPGFLIKLLESKSYFLP
ncbi:MAG: AAA family ATPase, partial [Spirochaetota bacterium]